MKSDEMDLGRPERHKRDSKVSDPHRMGFDPSTGNGQRVEVDENVTCTRCGCAVRIYAVGAEDSLIVSVARRRLASDELLCDLCLDLVEAEELKSEEEKRRSDAIESRLANSGIPERWRALKFDQLTTDADREAARLAAEEWAMGKERGVLLHGDVGRGKTIMAAMAAVRRCSVSPVRWLSVADLLIDLRMPFDSKEYAAAVRKLKPNGRPALVLDDLDKLKPTEHALQPLYVAINGWVEEGLPLLVTMNRDLDSLASWGGETFGDAIASRLAGHCRVVRVGGHDRRRA